MRLFGFRIKPGLIITLILGLLLIFFWRDLVYTGYVLVLVSKNSRTSPCTAMQSFRGLLDRVEFENAKDKFTDKNRSGVTLTERDPAGFDRWHTPQGDFWISHESSQVLPVLTAQQNIDIYGTGEDGVKPGDVVLDCGAHVGVFARKALALGASKVIAIEHGPENLECLRRNLKKEISEGRVIVCPEGVWNEETTLKFYTFASNSAADSFVEGHGGAGEVHEIKVTTIDALNRELGLSRIDFIKMDIKGSTTKALEGAQKVLQDFAPRLAISTEEATVDQPERIAQFVIKLQPAYKLKCGLCAINDSRILPMVIFFGKGPR